MRQARSIPKTLYALTASWLRVAVLKELISLVIDKLSAKGNYRSTKKLSNYPYLYGLEIIVHGDAELIEEVNDGNPLSWEEYEELALFDIAAVKEEHLQKKKEFRSGSRSEWIFRGHSNAEWKLETTLERFLGKEFDGGYPYFKYKIAMSKIYSSLQCFENTHQHSPKLPSHAPSSISGLNPIGMPEDNIPNYPLLAYLRHHGFPSPLLDWSKSYMVAAYFAATSPQGISSETHMAIFAARERHDDSEAYSPDQPHILFSTPYITTHPRHHLQKARYTWCGMAKNDSLYFAPHEKGFSQLNRQMKVKKFTLHNQEREKIMHRLSIANVTGYSLFGTIGSLLNDLAYAHLARVDGF